MAQSKVFQQCFKPLSLFGKSKNHSGVILLTVLWALTILVVLAVGLGRDTHMGLSLTKYSIGQIKAKYLAWAGVMYAMDKVRQGSDGALGSQDTLYHCAISQDAEVPPRDMFQDKALGEGQFDVQYRQGGLDGTSAEPYPGVQDEERKVNINANDFLNVDILRCLIMLLGEDERTAKTIAFSVLDWIDENDSVSSETYGAENDYYSRQAAPYNCKNRPFDSKSELLLVRGMTPEIFKKLKKHITVFPGKGKVKMNFDTASEPVLRAVMRSVSGPKTNTTESDADSLTEKLLDYRRGDDGEELTKDDRPIDFNQINLNAKEKVLFLVLNQNRTTKAKYLNIQVDATEHRRGVVSHVEAIVGRDDLNMVYWHRN